MHRRPGDTERAVGATFNVTIVNATEPSNVRVSPGDLTSVPLLSNLKVRTFGAVVRLVTSDGDPRSAYLHLTGPATIAGVEYTLTTLHYCTSGQTVGAFVTSVGILGFSQPSPVNLAFDGTDRTGPGCYEVDVDDTAAREGHPATFRVDGDGPDEVEFSGVTATWTPVS